MTTRTVYCVVGDFGDTREVMRIGKVLEERGVTIKYFVDSRTIKKAIELLVASGVTYETRGPMPTDAPDALLIGTAATATGAQIEWTKWGKERGILVLWMEDLHATGSRKPTQCVSPDAMFVIDSLAENIARTVRPDPRTIIVGKPTFSDPKEMPRLEDTEKIRGSVRGQLGLTDSDFLVVFAFGGEPPQLAEDQLQMIVDHLPRMTNVPNMVVAWRFHPKHPNVSGMSKKALMASESVGCRTIDTAKIDMKLLNVAADFCVATWGSTDRLAALLHGTPLATMMFPDQTQMLQDSGFPDAVPVCVATDPRAGSRDTAELAQFLHYVYRNQQEMRAYTREYRGKPFRALLLPGAAERAADVVMNVIDVREAYCAAHDSKLTDDLISVTSWPKDDASDLIDSKGSTAEETQKRLGAAEPQILPEDSGGCGNCGCSHG